MPRLPAITLVSALLLALSTLHTFPAAHALQPIGSGRMIRRYSHHNLYYRQTLDDILPEGDADPANPGDTDPGTNPDPGAGAGASQSSPTSTTTRPGGGLGGIIGGVGSGIGGSASPTETSTTTSTTTTTTERSTTTRASNTVTREPTSQQPVRTTTSTPQTTVTKIQYENATPEQREKIEENREYQSTLSRIPDNVKTILIVVASVLGGLIIIWTAVRRWKLRSSQSFQSRLAPIDWQPDNDKDKLAVPQGPADTSDKDSIRRNMFAPDGPSSLAPPAHDFTAGAAGYARSASPLSYARTASPAPYSDNPAPSGLQRYPSNGSGHGGVHGGYDQNAYHGGYDHTAHRGY